MKTYKLEDSLRQSRISDPSYFFCINSLKFNILTFNYVKEITSMMLFLVNARITALKIVLSFRMFARKFQFNS